MKRYGEKATREALVNGAIIRKYYDPMKGPVCRIVENEEIMGYIVIDLFTKLNREGYIKKSGHGYIYTEYTMTAQAAEKHPFSVAACVAYIRDSKMGLLHQDAKAIFDDLKHSEEVNGVFFNRNMWTAFGILFPDFVEEEQQPEETTTEPQEQPQEAPQEQPMDEDEENRAYAHRVAQEVDNYYRGNLRRCPCCEAIVERDDWDETETFICPHCDDRDTGDSWEPLTLHDYLSDVLDVTYIVGSDRQTLEGARFYVTLGGPSVWLDTCSRSVELRWGGRSASWGLSFALCDELEEIAQDWWDLG